MFSIIGWFAATVIMVFYSSRRVYKIYSAQEVSNPEYFREGVVMVVYSSILVGATSFLSASVSEYIVDKQHVQTWLVAVKLIAEYLRYLSPVLAAGIGLNLICFSITENKSAS